MLTTITTTVIINTTSSVNFYARGASKAKKKKEIFDRVCMIVFLILYTEKVTDELSKCFMATNYSLNECFYTQIILLSLLN